MKLEYIDGCTHSSMSIDGEELRDMDLSRIRNILTEIIGKETDLYTLQSVFRTLLECAGVEECSSVPCEHCGDYTIKYTLEIN